MGSTSKLIQVSSEPTRTFGQWPKIECLNSSTSILKGHISFDIEKMPPSISHSELHDGSVKYGGYWIPNCTYATKVAILVPYRNRPEQLEVFLSHMHPILQRQTLNYRVFVVEQIGNESFNKGAIYNIGFNRSCSYGDFECFVFHDIDLLSENDYNYYGCPASPMHMSPAIDKFEYKLSYPTLIGGIQAITKEHYLKLNGYSNSFWGWGAEDDNLYTRILETGLTLTRPDMKIGQYKMNQKHHFRSDGWSQVNKILLGKRKPRRDLDGLNSISTLNYTLNEILKPLYTLISIDLKR